MDMFVLIIFFTTIILGLMILLLITLITSYIAIKYFLYRKLFSKGE